MFRRRVWGHSPRMGIRGDGWGGAAASAVRSDIGGVSWGCVRGGCCAVPRWRRFRSILSVASYWRRSPAWSRRQLRARLLRRPLPRRSSRRPAVRRCRHQPDHHRRHRRPRRCRQTQRRARRSPPFRFRQSARSPSPRQDGLARPRRARPPRRGPPDRRLRGRPRRPLPPRRPRPTRPARQTPGAARRRRRSWRAR